MANVQKKQKADPDQYESKEYLTYEEAADYLGVRRSTLYNLVTRLDIATHKFRLNKKRYLAMDDVKRIREIREKPWLAGEMKKSNGKQEDAVA